MLDNYPKVFDSCDDYNSMTSRGFTLIELLVTVAIIGILASIAIPEFSDYKKRAFNARAASDLRNGITAQEAYFIDNGEYAECSDKDCENILPGFVLSEGVMIDMITSDGGYSSDAFHCQGDTPYQYSVSEDGSISITGVKEQFMYFHDDSC